MTPSSAAMAAQTARSAASPARADTDSQFAPPPPLPSSSRRFFLITWLSDFSSFSVSRRATCSAFSASSTLMSGTLANPRLPGGGGGAAPVVVVVVAAEPTGDDPAVAAAEDGATGTAWKWPCG